jgi:hypothetical protein
MIYNSSFGHKFHWVDYFQGSLLHAIEYVMLWLDVGPIRSSLWQNHLGSGFVARINLSDSRQSENTINTHKYNIILDIQVEVITT